jgi:hypothetical protein
MARTAAESKKLLDDKCQAFAGDIMFSGGDLKKLLEKHGLELRPGKDIESVRAAIQRGRKQGHGKVEFEQSMVGATLMRQFKLKAEEKKEKE